MLNFLASNRTELSESLIFFSNKEWRLASSPQLMSISSVKVTMVQVEPPSPRRRKSLHRLTRSSVFNPPFIDGSLCVVLGGG